MIKHFILVLVRKYFERKSAKSGQNIKRIVAQHMGQPLSSSEARQKAFYEFTIQHLLSLSMLYDETYADEIWAVYSRVGKDQKQLSAFLEKARQINPELLGSHVGYYLQMHPYNNQKGEKNETV